MKRLSLALTFFFTSSGFNSWAQFNSTEGSVVPSGQVRVSPISAVSNLPNANIGNVAAINASLPYNASQALVQRADIHAPASVAARWIKNGAQAAREMGITGLSATVATRVSGPLAPARMGSSNLRNTASSIAAPLANYRHTHEITAYMEAASRDMAIQAFNSNIPLESAREDAGIGFELPAAKLYPLAGPEDSHASAGSIGSSATSGNTLRPATGGGSGGTTGPSNPSSPAGSSGGNNNNSKKSTPRKWLSRYEAFRVGGVTLIGSGLAVLVFGSSFGLGQAFLPIIALVGAGGLALTHGVLGAINEPLSRYPLGTAPTSDDTTWRERVSRWQGQDHYFLYNKPNLEDPEDLGLAPNYSVNPRIGVIESVFITLKSIKEFISAVLHGGISFKDRHVLYSVRMLYNRIYNNNVRAARAPGLFTPSTPISGHGSLTDGVALQPSGDGFVLKQEARPGATKDQLNNFAITGITLTILASGFFIPGYFKIIPLILSLGIVGVRLRAPFLDFLRGIRKTPAAVNPAASGSSASDYFVSAALSTIEDQPVSKINGPQDRTKSSSRVDWRKVQVAALTFAAVFIGFLLYLHAPKKAPQQDLSANNVTHIEINLDDYKAALGGGPGHNGDKNDAGNGLGGGGHRDNAPATKGKRPKFSKTQFAAPLAHPNPNPKLAMDPSLLGPEELNSMVPNIQSDQFGDPLSKLTGPTSLGNGAGNGIGNGNGNGMGPGEKSGYGGGSPGGGGVALGWVGPQAAYPDSAKRTGKNEKVVVRFFINGQGQLVNPNTHTVVDMSNVGNAIPLITIVLPENGDRNKDEFIKNALDAILLGLKQGNAFKIPPQLQNSKEFPIKFTVPFSFGAH